MYDPYEPYIGCWDGALDEVDRAIELCGKYGMTVLIDVHAMKDSQNGLDNSGVADQIQWYDNSTFHHWDLREGDWIGHFNLTSQSYSSVNKENLLHGLRVVKSIVDMYKHNPVVVGVEPGAHTLPSTSFFSCNVFIYIYVCMYDRSKRALATDAH